MKGGGLGLEKGYAEQSDVGGGEKLGLVGEVNNSRESFVGSGY
jgi:hypothetical protein